MLKTVLSFVFGALIFSLYPTIGYTQQTTDNTDTFFLVKKKGLLGQLGKSISTSGDDSSEPIQKANPYFIYLGKTIRKIKIVRLGFERDINDTTKFNNNFGTIVANGFHKKTKTNVIANNLFFDAGDKINPYLMADNERHLREQPFVQDALIVIQNIEGVRDMVDVTVIIKDVFSLGGGLDIGSAKKIKAEVKEENLGGTGSRLTMGTLYDSDRKPKAGFGIDFLKRNIKGTFINWNTGFKTFNNAFNSGRNEESFFYTSFDKPLVSAYIRWIGGLDLTFNKTKNNYVSDSLYKNDFKYSYQRVDGWFGYNLGRQQLVDKRLPSRLRKFIAIRGLYQHFNDLPEVVETRFDYRYTDISGMLGSFSMFKQNFLRTNFIYGFGRNEDVPEGFDLALVAGWINKKDSIISNTRSRPYLALEGLRSHFNAKGFFSTYTFRIGGYAYRKRLEDVDILLNVDRFTRKKKLGNQWYYRQFYSAGFTRQILTTLNQPLFLNSEFGLPYFNNGNIQADLRCTAKTEAVFYNLHKFWGFRFAPFIFADACLIKSTGEAFSKSELYSAIGAGIRSRNENLVFGTIELKGFYFPRTVPGMDNWRVELGSNIRFKYNSVFVRRPDFITAN